MRTKQDGFTLLELVITLIILGLMLGMGLPAMTKMIQGTGVREAANTLVRDFNIARSQASDLNQNITLCRRTSGTTNCRGAGPGAGWHTDGWLIFLDDDQNAVPDVAGEFIRITDPLTTVTINHNGVNGNTFNGTVRFAPDGTVRDANFDLAEVNFNICPLSPSVSGRTVDMNNRGNIRTSIAAESAFGRGCP